MTTIASAVLAGVAVLLAGNLVWGLVLAPLNLRFFPTVPWAILPMAAYLWLYWKAIGGAIGSKETAAQRRELLRANPVPAPAWALALVSGLLGYGALLTLVAIMARLMTMPESAPITMPAAMPALTSVLLLVMAAIVAGVTEEAGFRGYMQGPIERRYGLATAILVNGAAFGLLHFPNHPGQVLLMLPYYLAVAAVYGGMTWAANSILPALVLHSAGDVWSLTRLWITGRPEWQIVSEPRPLIWDAGMDVSFLVQAGAFLALSVATWRACVATARITSTRGRCGSV
jgi:membrane protease YdiL (CAAX protease family)